MHSFTGLWLVLFLIEHLLTNSQAALWFDDDGSGFVRGVNFIQSLPYLHAIELFLLGVPFLIHMAWGVKYLRTGKSNAFPSDGTTPSLTEYSRNHAYTWQRITSWILLFAVVAHVVQMRFINYPSSAKLGHQEFYMVKLSLDSGLYPVAARLNVELFDQQRIEQQTAQWNETVDDVTRAQAGLGASLFDAMIGVFVPFEEDGQKGVEVQKNKQQVKFLETLKERKIESGEVIAVASDFGTAELLVVRETFKMPLMLVLYSGFVLAAAFHGFNGLWTFLITWGVSLTPKSQIMMRKLSVLLTLLIALLGFAAIWGTYLVTLKN